MKPHKNSARVFLLLVCCFIPLASAHAQGTAPTREDTLESLLKEVRLLRESFQRMSANSYLAEILIERARAQSDRVTRLERMLESTTEEAANLQQQINLAIEQAKLADEQVEQITDPKQRSEVEQNQKQLKLAIEQHKQRLESLKEREMRLNTEVQTEYAKLSEMESRLDLLEREIRSEIERARAKP